MLSSLVLATTDVLPVAWLDRLAEYLPQAWMEQALSPTGTASTRRRIARRTSGVAGHCPCAVPASVDARSAGDIGSGISLRNDPGHQQECSHAGQATSGKRATRILVQLERQCLVCSRCRAL